MSGILTTRRPEGENLRDLSVYVRAWKGAKVSISMDRGPFTVLAMMTPDEADALAVALSDAAVEARALLQEAA